MDRYVFPTVEKIDMKRRLFLKTVGGSVITTAAMAPEVRGGEVPQNVVNGFPRRRLGRTGQTISMVGFPGLSLRNYSQDEGTAKIHETFERGLNYYDVAPAYGPNGECEVKMGIGMEGIDRDKVFLSCKTKRRDKAGAKEELDRSLKRLKTDHFDLYQLHCLFEPDEVNEALDKSSGAMATILDAQKAGIVKYIGFSAHTSRAAIAALQNFEFDTVMFPINFVEQQSIGMGKQVIDLAHKQDAGIIAIKSISKGTWPEGTKPRGAWWYRWPEEQDELSLFYRWTMSQKNLASAIPCSFFPQIDMCMEAARSFTPITEDEVKQLRIVANDCESLFRARELKVALGRMPAEPFGSDNPHECFRHNLPHGRIG
jgi:predicted aldo/keto reductase-like oxidoreductase